MRLTMRATALAASIALIFSLLGCNTATAQGQEPAQDATPAAAAAGTLMTGQVMHQGWLTSAGGQTELLVESGDLGLYQYVAANGLTAGIEDLFIDQYVPSSDKTILVMQGDGNLVLYRSNGQALWNSRTAGTGKHNRLVVQDDGNLVIYTNANKAVWSSGTTKVVLGPGSKLASGTRWITRETLGRPGSTVLAMQTDGNLVLYRDPQHIWSTQTYVRGSYLTILANGNLKIIAPNSKTVWSSGPQPGCQHCWMALTLNSIQISGGSNDQWVRPYPPFSP